VGSRSVTSARPGFGGWIDRWRGLFDRPIDGGASFLHVFFAAALVLLVVEAFTGLLLALVYVPHPEAAWASTFFIQEVIRGGWFIRGVHLYAGHAMLIVLGLHLVLVAVFAGYRSPHRAQWWTVLLILGVLFGALVTGHRLVWDQNNYWALEVELNIVGAVPLVGDPIRKLVLGGSRIGQMTLTRLYALHVVLCPLVLWGGFQLWRSLRRADGPPPPPGEPAPAEPYFPRQAVMDGTSGLLVLGLVAGVVAWTGGAPLGGPAEPQRNFPALPEWFILPLYELRALVPPSVEIPAITVLPGIAVALVVALPFLDRGRTEASARGGLLRRLPALGAFGLVLLGAAALLGFAKLSPTPEERQEALAEAEVRADRAFELARDGIPPGGPLEMLRNDPLTRGKDVYVQYCTSCHVLGDRGAREAPDHTGFASEAWILALLHDPDAPHFFGETPIDDMPSQSDKGQEALEGAAAFLFSLGVDPDRGEEPPDASLVARGRELWENKCMTCHLFEGDGDFLGLGGPDLTGYASLDWLVTQTANPEAHYGDLNEMPAYDDQLTDHDLRMVSEFLRRQRFEEPVFPKEAPEPSDDEADGGEGKAERAARSVSGRPGPRPPRGG